MTALVGLATAAPHLLAQQGGFGTFLTYTVFGIVLAAIYFIAASGLVVTYTTTGIFNFAHGAVGMIGAYLYWQLVTGWGVPVVPSLLLILLVLAPLLGIGIERGIMRRLQGVSDTTRMVVSIALLFTLIQAAPIIWNPKQSYSISSFFGSSSVDILGAGVTFHQLTTIAIAMGVAVFLRYLLYVTRLGISMRAVVDNRGLSQLNGARPSGTSSAAWGLGASLAALAGILLAERVTFDPTTASFLVVNAYAAAVVGRLTSLTRTLVGALIVGLAQAYSQGYITSNPQWVIDLDLDVQANFRAIVPMVLLLVVLLLVPQARLRAAGIHRSRESVPLPTWSLTVGGCVALIGAAGVIAYLVSAGGVVSWSQGIGLAIIMLSLVPLTGYGGQVSLAQMSFAGLGAYAAATWGDGSIVSLLAAVVLAAVAGAIVALPALRLTGVYLALATLAFAFIVEQFIFKQPLLFPTSAKPLKRFNLLGLSMADDRVYMVFLAVVFSLLTLGIVALRRGPFGRRLQAMKDSPAACATLGLSLTRTKLQVFVLSSAIAGLGGALYAGVNETASTADYAALQNLPILLMAMAGGIALCSGALAGGLLLGAFAAIIKIVPQAEILGVESKTFFTNLFAVTPGLLGAQLAANPNGMVASAAGRIKAARLRIRTGDAEVRSDDRVAAPLVSPVVAVESMGVDGPFTDADLAAIERAVKVEAEIAPAGTPLRSSALAGAP